MEIEVLQEQLKTIDNIKQTCDVLIQADRYDLLATQLELMQIEIQDAVSDWCIEGSPD